MIAFHFEGLLSQQWRNFLQPASNYRDYKLNTMRCKDTFISNIILSTQTLGLNETCCKHSPMIKTTLAHLEMRSDVQNSELPL